MMLSVQKKEELNGLDKRCMLSSVYDCYKTDCLITIITFSIYLVVYHCYKTDCKALINTVAINSLSISVIKLIVQP